MLTAHQIDIKLNMAEFLVIYAQASYFEKRSNCAQIAKARK